MLAADIALFFLVIAVGSGLATLLFGTPSLLALFRRWRASQRRQLQNLENEELVAEIGRVEDETRRAALKAELKARQKKLAEQIESLGDDP